MREEYYPCVRIAKWDNKCGVANPVFALNSSERNGFAINTKSRGELKGGL